MKKSSIDDRMKRYENVNRYSLIRRTPVIIRLDGKAFHSFTKDLDKPFDEDLHNTFKQTVFYLVSQIQGAVFAYTQSDEISILLRDWDTLTTDAWFDYNIQKMASVSASIVTAKFNMLWHKSNKIAFFDSRVFNLPKEEVCNYFIWRQQDATKNSIN
ncbi:MAG: tRNA(His) guanylyltransferase Thg1 family protein, partial [Candidatus Woesearchaeota archaeon]